MDVVVKSSISGSSRTRKRTQRQLEHELLGKPTMDISALDRLLRDAEDAAAERGTGAGGSELDGVDRFTSPASLAASAAAASSAASTATGAVRSGSAAAKGGASHKKQPASAIWDAEEVPDEEGDLDVGGDDGRPRPECVRVRFLGV